MDPRSFAEYLFTFTRHNEQGGSQMKAMDVPVPEPTPPTELTSPLPGLSSKRQPNSAMYPPNWPGRGTQPDPETSAESQAKDIDDLILTMRQKHPIVLVQMQEAKNGEDQPVVAEKVARKRPSQAMRIARKSRFLTRAWKVGSRKDAWRPRYHPGTAARRRIMRSQKIVEDQKSTETEIPKSSIEPMIKEITQRVNDQGLRFHPSAVDALQEAAEAHLVDMFKSPKLLAMHDNRVTLQAQDMRLLKQLMVKFGVWDA